DDRGRKHLERRPGEHDPLRRSGRSLRPGAPPSGRPLLHPTCGQIPGLGRGLAPAVFARKTGVKLSAQPHVGRPMKRLVLGVSGLAAFAMGCGKDVSTASQNASNAFGGGGGGGGGGGASYESKSIASATTAPPATGAIDGLDKGTPSAAREKVGGWGIAPAQQQIGPVKAGEWDDNANYREFQRFLSATPASF